MTEEVKVNATSAAEESSALLELARKVLLASVGAVVVAQESAEKSINKFLEDVEQLVAKLVERGELAEKDARHLLSEVVEKRKAAAEETAEKARERARHAEQAIAQRVDEVVARLNVPSRDDIDTLRHKIVNLGRKVDQLKQTAEDDVSPATAVEAPVTEPEKLAA